MKNITFYMIKFIIDFMNINVNFTGITDDIMEAAIRKGLAKTKTEVLRLALFELKSQYNLLDDYQDLSTKEKEVLAQIIDANKTKGYKNGDQLWAALK